jgi:hypothetical protein
MKMTWLIDADGDIQNAIGDKIADMHITTSAHRTLIAAAPKMLAALKRAEHVMSALAGVGVPDALERVRAAITEATEENER